MSDIAFTNSAGLWALATLAIPVIIHLFNRSRGKLVIVGTIKFIEKAAMQRVTEVKLTDLLLLAVRLLLCTVAALILAGLVVRGLSTQDQPTGYVSPLWVFAASDDALQSAQDSQPLFLLDAELSPLTEAHITRIKQSDPQDLLSVTGWTALMERLKQQPHSAPVTLYVTNHGVAAPHVQYLLDADIQWQVATPMIQLPIKTVGLHIIGERSAGPQISFLKSALTMIEQHRSLRFQFVDAADADWVITFAGSDQALTPKGTANILHIHSEDISGPKQSIRLPVFPFAEFSARLATQPAAPALKRLWYSERGQPVLTQRRVGDKQVVHLLTNLKAADNSLVNDPAFRLLLIDLLVDPSDSARAFPYSAHVTNAVRDSAGGPAVRADEPAPMQSPYSLLVMILALLFMAERFLCERRGRHD